MPSSVIRTFTNPDAYFGARRNVQIDGLVMRRGAFPADSTRIDLHRLWMHRFDESLPRIMGVTSSGIPVGIHFAIDPKLERYLVEESCRYSDLSLAVRHSNQRGRGANLRHGAAPKGGAKGASNGVTSGAEASRRSNSSHRPSLRNPRRHRNNSFFRERF